MQVSGVPQKTQKNVIQDERVHFLSKSGESQWPVKWESLETACD